METMVDDAKALVLCAVAICLTGSMVALTVRFARWVLEVRDGEAR
jgi:hypothetical protein